MRGKGTFFSEYELRLLRGMLFPLTLTLSLGERE